MHFKNGPLIALSPWTALSGGELNNHTDNDDKRSTCFYLLLRLIKLTLKFKSNYFAMLTVSRKFTCFMIKYPFFKTFA